MAINQGLRQGPMTSADTPPPQHTLILSGGPARAHRRLQTWYTAASSLHLVVYVLIPQRQLSQKACREHMRGASLFHSASFNHNQTAHPVRLRQKWHLEGGEKPLHSYAAQNLRQPPDKIICIHLLWRAERGYANERWQCYCVRNINGVITVPCRAIGPLLPRPASALHFSAALSGERWAVCSGEQS